MLEVAIEEGRAANPDVVVQACTAATSAKDCLELTLHAQQAGADIVYIQTPMMEAHGGEGVLNFFRYIADRSDIALGHVQLTVVGVRADTCGGCADLRRDSARCARPRKAPSGPRASRLLHELAPDLTIWECETTVYRAGWLRAGIVGPAQLGTAGYLYETPQHRVFSEYWELVWSDKLIEAMDYAEKSGIDQFTVDIGGASPAIRGDRTISPTGAGRSSTRRRCSACPSGRTPTRGRRRPILPAEAKAQIDAAYQRFGLVGG